MAILKYLGKDNDYHSLPIGDQMMVIQPVEYTTDEIVIGSWIDGRPVYRKSVQLPAGTSLTAGKALDVKNFDLDPADIYLFTNAFVSVYSTAASDSGNASISIWSISSYFRIQADVGWGSPNRTFYLTAEYVKKSDAPGSFDISMIETVDIPTEATDDDVAAVIS